MRVSKVSLEIKNFERQHSEEYVWTKSYSDEVISI